MSLFTSIDLSKVPPPELVETLDYEVILAAIKAELQALAPELQVEALLESDPISKLLQVIAYREMHLRARINEAARGVMLASASGSNLDSLAALFNIERLLIEAADPAANREAVYEDDDRLRERAQLAFEGFSTAGPAGAYRFHALSASEKIKDVSVFSDSPGVVDVRLLSSENDRGNASQPLIDKVQKALNADEVRPLTDKVQVKSAEIVDYRIRATLILVPGVGASEVVAAANSAAQAFTVTQHKLGQDITRAAIFSALHQPGVQNVLLQEPSEDRLLQRFEAPANVLLELRALEQPTTVPANLATGITLTGAGAVAGNLSGTLQLEPAVEDYDISHYVVYWGGNNAEKLPLTEKLYQFNDDLLVLDHDQAIQLTLMSLDGKVIFVPEKDYQSEGGLITALNAALKNTQVRVTYALPPLVELNKNAALQFPLPQPMPIPEGATHLIVFSKNEFGEMPFGISLPISVAGE